MFIPITQNRIEEMPGCFYCITPCKEGLVAQDTVFYQTGIGISAGDAPQLIITEIHRYLFDLKSGSRHFHAKFQHNTFIRLQTQYQLIGSRTITTRAMEHLMRSFTEMHHYLSHFCRHLFSGPDIKRYSTPPPITDTQFHCNISLGT